MREGCGLWRSVGVIVLQLPLVEVKEESANLLPHIEVVSNVNFKLKKTVTTLDVGFRFEAERYKAKYKVRPTFSSQSLLVMDTCFSQYTFDTV